MKNQIHILIVQVVSLLALPGCDESGSRQPKPSTTSASETSVQKPIIPQNNSQPAPPSEPFPALDASVAKAAFEAVVTKRKGEKAGEGSAEFERLLRQWNPRGKTIQEVKIIIGRPDWEKDSAFGYRFDSGWGGWEWSLSHDGKVVTDVKRSGID